MRSGVLNTQKNVQYNFISICISILNFEVLKMGVKWGMAVFRI